MSTNKESESNSAPLIELADTVVQENDHIEETVKLISTVIIRVLADFLSAEPMDDRFDAISTLMDAVYKIKVDFFSDGDIRVLKEAWHRLHDSNIRIQSAIYELDQGEN